MKFNCYRYQLCIDNGIIDERSFSSENMTAYDDNGQIEFNSKLDKSIRSVRCRNLDLCMKDNQKFSNELSELILKLRKYVV